MKQVVVLMRRPPHHPRTAQGLRAAVAYSTARLQVTVVLGGAAAQLRDLCEGSQPPPPFPSLCRALRTLRALGHRVVCAEEIDLCALLQRADAIVTW